MAAGLVDLKVHDLRDFTTDRHRVVDDVPYGGGPGMVLKPEPLVARGGAHQRDARDARQPIVLTSPQGRVLTQARTRRGWPGSGTSRSCAAATKAWTSAFASTSATEEISIGDYVLSGGELAALVIVDAVSRFVPGVVGDERSVSEDSFSRGLLDYPHYTRPAEFQGWKVPDVLLSGHHAEIDRWRRREALRRTLARRPELLAGAVLDEGERALYRELQDEGWKEQIMSAIEAVERSQMAERPRMKSGDTVRVHVKVREGDKERVQVFEGIVIGMHRGGLRASFTVRKVSFGQGVERIFPLHSPTIQKVEVVRSARVRRAKLYFLRDLKGKAARMKETKRVVAQ